MFFGAGNKQYERVKMNVGDTVKLTNPDSPFFNRTGIITSITRGLMLIYKVDISEIIGETQVVDIYATIPLTLVVD